jgi:hypothetical protein
MKNSKRLTNTTGLKITFIPATNTQGDKFRLTQTNSKKSITINGNLNLEIIDFICSVLDKIELIESYSFLVDNTQNKYNLFSIDFKGNSFENILENFKNY